MNRRDFIKAAAAPVVVASFGLKLEAKQTLIKGLQSPYLTTGDIIHVPRTGEHMLVKAIGRNGTQLIRGWGKTVMRAVKDDDPVWLIGNATTDKEPKGRSAVVEGTKWMKEEIFPAVMLWEEVGAE
jgi:hypothetical protein